MLSFVKGTVAVHGTVDLHSDVVIGTVAVSNIGTLATVSSGSVGILDGTIGVISTVSSGSVGILDGTIGEVTNIAAIAGGDIGTVQTVQSGSVGILGGTVDNRYGGVAYTPVHKYLQAVQPEGTIWTPAAGKTINVTDLIVNTQAAGTVELRCNGTFTILDLAANRAVVSNFKTQFKGAADKELTIYLSGGTVNVTAEGFES